MNKMIRRIREDGAEEFILENAEEVLAAALLEPQDDDAPTLTQEEIDEWNNSQYQRDRLHQYPEIGEQLDKLFHDIENGTLDQSGEFFVALKAVKDSNPKT